MLNHVHLILQVSDIPLSRIMQNIALRFTRWINMSQGRCGHVFQGRYKALLIDAEAYLLEIVRYVHLNPVRAGIVDLPADYPWSGHRAYMGLDEIPWLCSDWLLSLFCDNIREARTRYLSFVMDGMEEGRRSEFHSGACEGRILGDDNFADRALTMANQRKHRTPAMDDAVEVVCGLYGITVEQLRARGKARPFTEARALLTLLVRECTDISLTELGRYLGRDLSPLTRSGELLAAKAEGDHRIASLIGESKRRIGEWRKGEPDTDVVVD
jgi:hypothetical protein